RLPGMRRLCSAEVISFKVRSGCSRIRAQICCEYLSNGEVNPSTPHWFASPVLAKALHPADCRTGTDLKLFGRFASRSSRLHEVNYANPQLTRIRSPHCLALWRINALESLIRRSLGIPIHSGRDAL